MAQILWSGAVGFALIDVPVKPLTAAGDRAVRFEQFQDMAVVVAGIPPEDSRPTDREIA